MEYFNQKIQTATFAATDKENREKKVGLLSDYTIRGDIVTISVRVLEALLLVFLQYKYHTEFNNPT